MLIYLFPLFVKFRSSKINMSYVNASNKSKRSCNDEITKKTNTLWLYFTRNKTRVGEKGFLARAWMFHEDMGDIYLLNVVYKMLPILFQWTSSKGYWFRFLKRNPYFIIDQKEFEYFLSGRYIQICVVLKPNDS